MILPREGHLLRIFIGESDRFEGMTLYEWIVRKAREQGLDGAVREGMATLEKVDIRFYRSGPEAR
jgi:PII-like signaling protein